MTHITTATVVPRGSRAVARTFLLVSVLGCLYLWAMHLAGGQRAEAESSGELSARDAAANGPSVRTDPRSKLIGVWKLVSIEERDAQGRLVVPLDYGPNPIGMLIYEAGGHMSVHAMRRGRAKLPSDDVHSAPAEAAKAAFVGYNAYFGTFEVDAQRGLVIHHVEGAMIPNWEGTKQVRRFRLEGDKLILEPPQFEAAGQQRTRRLTWQRVAAPSTNTK